MGVYLNSKNPYGMFLDEAASMYFIDKSEMLLELLPMVENSEDIIENLGSGTGKSNRYLCITPAPPFWKNSNGYNDRFIFRKRQRQQTDFEKLKVRNAKEAFEAHINKHNVIYISLNEVPQNCSSYEKYIGRIEKRLRNDLKSQFPDIEVDEEEPVWDILNDIYESEDEDRFIFVLDEWDYIFHRDFVREKDKKAYVEFLSNLLKGKSYVELAYMTGILPIAKYSSGSELNMFMNIQWQKKKSIQNISDLLKGKLTNFIKDIKLRNLIRKNVTREGLRIWYDGYHTKAGERVYNPRSVVAALTNNNLGNYWTSSGPYDEIFYYIRENVDAVRDDLALLVSGIPVQAKVREYAATSMNLRTKNEIFSAMVVYGFLNYENGYVSIPNKELMDKFADMLQKEPSLGYVYRLAAESSKMLQATKDGNTELMAKILEYAHNTESPLLNYNNEAELTMIVNMVYLSARDSYRIEREDKAGIGYVDFIFILCTKMKMELFLN